MSDPGFLRKLARAARAVAPKAAPKVEDIYHPPGSPEREENFARFLSGSKIRNDEGDPLRLYHITKGDFNEFVPGGSADPKAWESGPATWLSPYPDKQPAAHQVGGYRGDDGERVFRSGTNVMPVHAAIKNPLIIDDATSHDWARKVFADDSAEFPQLLSPQTRARMLEDGYDGIVYAGPSSTRATEAFYGSNAIGTHPDREEEIISLLPNSLKSATGNRGTYDPMLPDINKAEGGPVEMETGGGVLRKLIRAYHGSPPQPTSRLGDLKSEIATKHGTDQARRFEQAADSVDLGRFSDDALRQTFGRSDTGLYTTMPPGDFEKFASMIPGNETQKTPYYKWFYDRDRPLLRENQTYPAYMDRLNFVSQHQGGLDEVPFLNLSPSEPFRSVVGHEGRHRMRMLNEGGERDALVHLRPENFGRYDDRVERLMKQYFPQGSNTPYVPQGDDVRPMIQFPKPVFEQGGPVDTPTEGEGGMYGAPDSMFNTPESLAAALYPQHDTAYGGGGKVLRKAGQLARDALLGDLPEYKKGEETYLRYGKWPENERSQNFAMGHAEEGVSVYPLDYHGGLPLDWSDEGEHAGRVATHMGRHDSRGDVFSDESNYPRFLVQGDRVGSGHDDEPLLQDVSPLSREWHSPQLGDRKAGTLSRHLGGWGSKLPAVVKPFDDQFAHGGPVHMALGGTPPNTAPTVPDMPQLPESEGAGFFRNNNDNENYAGLEKIFGPGIIRPGKVKEVYDWGKKVGGDAQGQRIEQAADLTNLEQFTKNALYETFAPGNSSLLMALPPGRFENFSKRIPAEYMARSPYGRWANNVPGQERIPDSEKTMNAYLDQIRGLMDRGGVNEVPAMWLAPPRPLYGEVVEHQGRHRGREMARAGEENMLLQIRPSNDGDMRGSLAERLERLTDKYFPSGAATRFEPEMDWKRRIPLSFPFAPFAEGGEVHMSTGGQYDAPESEGAGYLRNNVGDMYAGVDDLIKGGWRTALARQHKQDTPKGKAAPPDRRLQTVTDPERMVYPGIYKDPNVIAEEASRRLMRDQGKDGPMSLLFGHTRASLDELSQGRDLEGMRPWPLRQAYTPPGGSTGSAVSEQVLTRRNANRLLDIHGEAMKYPGLRETRSWYEMLPLYQRMDELGVPIDEQRLFNQRTGIFSAAASPVSEINRGTLAHHLAQQGRIEDFVKYGGVAAKNRPSLLGFPDDLLDMKSHAYHGTAQAPTLAEIEMSGGYYPKEHKVGTYVAATDPVFPNYTRPVADSHIARGVGYSDVRPGKLANVKANLSNPEYTDFAPWWENSIAGNTGLRSRDQQALLWNVLGPQTGVRYIGPSKLELMSNQMMQASKRLGVTPEQARDMVLRGEAGAYKEGGTVEDQYHPIWQQSFAGGGQPEEEPRGFFKSPYTPKERAAIAREQNAERLAEMHETIRREGHGNFYKDALGQTGRGVASIAELLGLPGEVLNAISPNEQQRVPDWMTMQGISDGLDRVFPETTTTHGAQMGRELGNALSGTIGLGIANKAGALSRFAGNMGNRANLGSVLAGTMREDAEPSEWQGPDGSFYRHDPFLPLSRLSPTGDAASPPDFVGMAHGGSVEDQYHPIWSQNFEEGGPVEMAFGGGFAPSGGGGMGGGGMPWMSLLQDGMSLGKHIEGGPNQQEQQSGVYPYDPLSGLWQMTDPDLETHDQGELIGGDIGRGVGSVVGSFFGPFQPLFREGLGRLGGGIGAMVQGRFGEGISNMAEGTPLDALFADGGPVEMSFGGGFAPSAPTNDFTEPGMPSFGNGIPGFDVPPLPFNPQVARDKAERNRLMQMTEQAAQKGLAEQMKAKESGGGGGLGGMLSSLAPFANMIPGYGPMISMGMNMAGKMMAADGGRVNHPFFDGGRVNHPFFDKLSMYAAGDIADDKVKGYGHLREDAHEYLADNNLSERARAPRTEIGTWTERVRDYNERDMAEDRFPMFADGGSIPAPNGEQPWMYGGGALMARGGYLRSHGGMNG